MGEAVPGFKHRAKKEKFLKFFERRVFNPGHVLIREGEPSEAAYIVRKGELRLVSHQIPMVIRYASSLSGIARCAGRGGSGRW